MAAKGFDELLDFLRDEVALRFGDGASLDEFKDAVDKFYDDPDAAAARDAQIDGRLVSAADRQLHEKAWAWLLRCPDIWVGRSTGENSPPEILVAAEQDASTLSLVQAETAELTADDNASRIRVWTSHERVWQTVAGHGVDFKRIPGEEFRLLCLIAAAGSAGIAQPLLVQKSKQDKKSVPGRTDSLHKAGYIRKTKILIEKHNTSLLVHRRFVPTEELDVMSRPVFVNGSLSFDNFLAVLKEKLNNGRSMKMEDLENFLGCSVKSWEKRALWRALERLDIIGVVQRFRMDEIGKSRSGLTRSFMTRHIRLLRDPTAEDYKRYFSLTTKDREDFRRRLELQDADSKGEHAEFMDDDDYAPLRPNPDAASSSLDNAAPGTVSTIWDPDLPWTNTIFNAVEATGITGLSSMNARDVTFGRFYDRPVEQMLARLTDIWQKSQPDHLKHLSIIRDTDTQGRSTNYIYRTHDAFQQAVDEGATFWENMVGGKTYEKPVPKLDQFGFSPVDNSQFVKNGAVTLSEAVIDADIRFERVQRADPVLEKKRNGTVEVVWRVEYTPQWSSKPKSGTGLDGLDEEEIPVTPKKRGAKPKGRSNARKKKRLIVSDDDEEDEVDALEEEEDEDESESDTSLPPPPPPPPKELTVRETAEEQAYFESWQPQKLAPVLSAVGKQVPAVWNAGRGRARMILVNDIDFNGDAKLPKAAAGARKLPVIVFESRVRAIEAELQTATGVTDMEGEVKKKDSLVRVNRRSKRFWVSIKLSRLSDLGWFVDDIKKPAVSKSSKPSKRRATSPATASPARKKKAKKSKAIANEKSGEQDPSGKSLDEQPAKQGQVPEEVTVVESELTEIQAAPLSTLAQSPTRQQQAETPQVPVVSQPAEGTEEAVPAPPRAQTPVRQKEAIEPGKEAVQDAPKSSEMPDTPSQRQWGRSRSTYVRAPPVNSSHRRKKGILVGSGTASYRRMQLVKQIIEKCGGVFPGDGEMIPAFQKMQKDELKSATTADRDTIMKALKSLVDDGTYLRFGFFFTDRSGRNVQKFILRQPHIAINASEVQELMKKIEDSYPKNYVPPPYGDDTPKLPEQRKNIDRFQYRPGVSVIKPSGTDFVIDIDAKRKELEDKRLAAAAAVREEELKRLRAQSARNKKRQAALIGRLRHGRATLQKTTRPDISMLDAMDEDDPDAALPSVELEGLPLSTSRHGRARYRAIRPAPVLDADHAKSRSGAWADYVDLSPEHWRYDTLHFEKPQGPQYYDRYYHLRNVPSLLMPVQRFHPNTGTFSTDFLVRRRSPQPMLTELAFENHTTTALEDLQWYASIKELDNYFHPDKKRRGKAVHVSDEESESEGEADGVWTEQKELKTMREEYPNLLQESEKHGFVNFLFTGDQDIPDPIYVHGIKPMDRVIFHGARIEEFGGVAISKHKIRPNMPSGVGHDDFELAAELGVDLSIEPSPRAYRKKSATQRNTTSQALGSPRTPRKTVKKPVLTQSGDCQISSADMRRLFFACIVVRVIAGELDGTITWSVIREIFSEHPNYDLPTFKAQWTRMRLGYKEVLARVTGDFQIAFVDALEKGDIPAPELINGVKMSYNSAEDWAHVVNWAMKTIPVFPEEVQMPSTRSQLNNAFEFKTEPSELQDLREKMDHIHATHTRREQIAHLVSFSLPIVGRSTHNVTNFADVASSWIRANAATAENTYNEASANAKLGKLDQNVVRAVLKQLHAQKIIAHSFKLRNKLTRNYRLSDQYNQIFNRRPLSASAFADARAFKARLDSAFATSTRVLLNYDLTEGIVLAVTEMLAAGRIVVKPVLPPIDSTIGNPWPRLSVWGFNEGAYKLRNMDRKIFLWDVEIVPTEGYIYGLPIQTIEPPRAPKHDGKEWKRIPLWYDIHGNLLPNLWAAMVLSVAQHMAVKAGSSIDTLTAPYRGLVWEWEVEVLVQWLVDIGVARYTGQRSVVAQEWWWTVVPGATQLNPINKGNGEAQAGVAKVKAVAPTLATPKKRRLRREKADEAVAADA